MEPHNCRMNYVNINYCHQTVWNFCRWGADISPGKTSRVARSENFFAGYDSSCDRILMISFFHRFFTSVFTNKMFYTADSSETSSWSLWLWVFIISTMCSGEPLWWLLLKYTITFLPTNCYAYETSLYSSYKTWNEFGEHDT